MGRHATHGCCDAMGEAIIIILHQCDKGQPPVADKTNQTTDVENRSTQTDSGTVGVFLECCCCGVVNWARAAGLVSCHHVRTVKCDG